jgi:hypothetical protein
VVNVDGMGDARHWRFAGDLSFAWLAVDGDFLLLEVAPVLFVDEDKVEVVSRAEFLVHVAEGGGKVEATQEESDGDGLSYTRGMEQSAQRMRGKR